MDRHFPLYTHDFSFHSLLTFFIFMNLQMKMTVHVGPSTTPCDLEVRWAENIDRKMSEWPITWALTRKRACHPPVII